MSRKSDILSAEGDPRWAAVVTRNPEADGTFVYAVRTTGVYCRPSCGARTANHENVEFYLTPSDAEKAGYRPCIRCTPDQPSPADRNALMVAELCRQMEQADRIPSLSELARHAGTSPHHLHRLFKAATGVTPREFAVARRRKRLREELVRSDSVTDAIYGAGYNSSGRFYEDCKQVLGMTPTQYRTGGAGMTIRFAVGECYLGSILVAATRRGVCAVLLGDDPDELVRDLQDRFPRAALIGGDDEFEQLVAKVVGFVEAPGIGCNLPLDLQGTAFQQRVWQALRQIPPGETASYAEIARRIGSPNAVRGVAGACAANPLAVVIPCHRVVRSDGGLSGYRWGVERKRALLDREKTNNTIGSRDQTDKAG